MIFSIMFRFIIKSNYSIFRIPLRMASKLIASELAKLDKLIGTNYDMWHRKIRYALIHDNIEYVIDTDAPEVNKTSTEVEKRK